MATEEHCSYSLLDQPWLPVRFGAGQVRDVGLLELFGRIGEITALAETSPPSLIAQYRLLLAITHRALALGAPGWKTRDLVRWYRDGFPAELLRGYLEQQRDRFWLFHPEQPFMQVAALAQAEETRDKQKPWTQISLASANGNTPVVFDHSCDLVPISITPALALRTLLGFLQFTPGGLVKTLRDADKAGPLANTAAVIPVGPTLGQTLLLALHPASTGTLEDLPSWEQPPATIAQLRGDATLATGPNDRYTRLSRAVLLLPEPDGRIRHLRFAAGLALAEDSHAPDPMASYRAGSDNLIRVAFQEGRAFWRDLSALLPDPTGKMAHPAAVLQGAVNLNQNLTFDTVEQPLLVAGLASEKAKLLRWRTEQITLPAALMADSSKAIELRQLVGQAETVFGHLRSSASHMLADMLPDPGSKDTRSRARSLFDSGAATALFFSHAERLLGPVMTLLADERGNEAQTRWCQALLAAADQGWKVVHLSMGQSPTVLRAEARHWPRYRGWLKSWQSETDPVCMAQEASA